MNIVLENINKPVLHDDVRPVDLTSETMEQHKQAILSAMHDRGLDALIVYADREHGANFAYLTGFEPRFEEAVLVLHSNGASYFLLGNENLKMAKYSFLQGTVIHAPYFSLPYQPMATDQTLDALFRKAGLDSSMNIGIAGWKLFTGTVCDTKKLYDIPQFIFEAIAKTVPYENIINAADLFIDSEYGARTSVNANEIAHFEFGSCIASCAVYRAIDSAKPGKTELEVADCMRNMGQPITVTTICASGERFTNAVVFPRDKEMKLGDRLSVTMGLRGGLSSRAAYIAEKREDIPEQEQGYLEKVAIPYYRAVVTWLESMKIGTRCNDIYNTIENILPKDTYHWTLNPGHYTGDDEWSSSPFYPGSKAIIRSGMLLQLDIIPGVPGYGGVSAEDGIAIADENLRRELKDSYPETWNRMMERKEYISSELGIMLPEEVLPMSDILGYLRPYVLDESRALCVR